MSLVHALTRSLILLGWMMSVDTHVDTLLKCSIIRSKCGARDFSLGLLHAFPNERGQAKEASERAHELDELGALNTPEKVKLNERELAGDFHSVQGRPIEAGVEESKAFGDLTR